MFSPAPAPRTHQPETPADPAVDKPVDAAQAARPETPASDLPAHPPLEIDDQTLERLRLKLRYKVLYHVGHNCADVDDLVQESLTRFIRAGQRGQIRNTEESGAFLNGVCRNVILEYRRRMRREPGSDQEEDIPERSVRPEAEILEMRESIDSGLAELAERDRAVLRELYLEGKDKDEICREWNMSDAQFRVVLFRAKERFRRAYCGGEMKQNA